MINYSTAPLINWPQRFSKRRPSSVCVPMFVCSRVLLTRRLIGISRCRRLVHTERDACFGWQKAQHARVRFRPIFLTLVGFFCLCYDHFCEYLWKELEWRDRGTACRHCVSLFCYSILTDFAKNRKQFVDVFGRICNHSQYQSTWFLRRCSVCLCPLWFAIQHLFFLPECVPYPLSCHGCCTVSHNPLSSLDPSDCGCPGGQGPSADYHEAADWIVFLIPGGWPLQEHPNTGVWLSSTGQTSVTYKSNYHCTYTPTPSENLFRCPKRDKPLRVLAAWIRLYCNFPLLVSSWRGGVLTGNTTVISFWQIMKYSEQRIPTLNEYCVVCDEQHVFQNGSMLKVMRKISNLTYYTDPVAHFKMPCYITEWLQNGPTIANDSMCWRRLVEIEMLAPKRWTEHHNYSTLNNALN